MGIISKTLNYIFEGTWTIGFTTASPKDIVEGKTFSVNWITNHYNNRWFADPFILEVDEDYIYVFVEEYNDEIRRGRISKLRINKKNYRVEDISVVLQLDQHLSFPAILRRKGKILIYPENSASGKLILYEYLIKENKCIPVCTLANAPLTDAILTDVFGQDEIFSTQIPTQNGCLLTKFTKKEEEFVMDSNITLKSNEARNAGNWFVCEGKIYRPAQDCSSSYGRAIIIQEVSYDKEGMLSFKDIRTIESPHTTFKRGCHTLNFYGGYGVIDVFGYRHPALAKLGKILYLNEIVSWVYGKINK